MTSARRVALIGHRTLPEHAPENSLAGIRAAADLDLDAVEIDVRRTRDGVPVLMHDWLAWRTTRSLWPIRLMTLARFLRLRFRPGPGRPPTFAHALDELLAVSTTLRFAIDTKHPSAAPMVVEEVRRRGAEHRVLLWAQDAGAVRTYARAFPDVECALLRDTSGPDEARRYLDDAVAAGARAVSVHEDGLTDDLFAGAAERGLTVYTWLQSPSSHDERMSRPVDGIVTDWPELVRAAGLSPRRRP